MASGIIYEGVGQQAQDARDRPRLIEMVGIGGAGKSTLFKALSRDHPKIQKLGPPPKLRYLPTILRLAFRWLPVHLSKYRGGRWFTWDEMRNICYLDTQLSHVRAYNLSQGIIAVLDPGSIYWLSSLREFGPEFTKDPLFCNWWDEQLATWAAALDLIVWIEAPVELLLERVLARDEVHEARTQSREVALAYFERYQSEYSKMVPEVAGRGHTRLFHFWSDQVTTEEMLREIVQAVDLQAA